MRFKTETKMRIQALKYRDGLENHQIAREMGISQTMIWQYVESLDKQIKAGEITVADIVSSCNALKIEGPKKVRKQEDKIVFDEASNMTDKQVDEMLSEQGMAQQELSENVQALDDALSKAGEPDGAGIGFDEISATQYQLSEAFQSRGGIVKPIKGHEPDIGKEMTIPIKKQRRGGRQRQIVEIDGEPANKKMKGVSPEFDIITKYMTKSLLVLDDITKILDASAELKNCGYTAEEIVLALTGNTDSENKQPTSQREFVLGILGYLYDELVAGNIKLSHYIMENGMYQLQFTEVEDDHSNRTGR